jgi:hypothetical protein
LTALQGLNLSGTRVTNFGAMKRLPALRSLVLSEMPSDILDRFNGSRAEMGLHRVEAFPMYYQFLGHKNKS